MLARSFQWRGLEGGQPPANRKPDTPERPLRAQLAGNRYQDGIRPFAQVGLAADDKRPAAFLNRALVQPGRMDSWGTNVGDTLYDAIEQMACDYLEETGVNWYDSGGGFEELVLDMPNRTRGLEINSCYINKETEFAEGQEFDELINGVDDPLKRKFLHLSSEGPFF